jgi:hypothetical protein
MCRARTVHSELQLPQLLKLIAQDDGAGRGAGSFRGTQFDFASMIPRPMSVVTALSWCEHKSRLGDRRGGTGR